MSAQLVFVRVHEPEQAREIIDAAYTIASETTSDEREFVAVFEKAVDLLAARLPIMPTPTAVNFPFDPLKLRQ